MGWMLRLVETGTDSRARSVDVLEISRPNDLGDIANLGLTLPEAKQLLARVQQAVVAAQAYEHLSLASPRRMKHAAWFIGRRVRDCPDRRLSFRQDRWRAAPTSS